MESSRRHRGAPVERLHPIREAQRRTQPDDLLPPSSGAHGLLFLVRTGGPTARRTPCAHRTVRPTHASVAAVPRRNAPCSLLVALVAVALATPAVATLQTPDFRAVGVAHAFHPVVALATAPDGRLFAAEQALAATSGRAPGTAEIRVYSAYASDDGSVLDEGITWATVTDVRATGDEEGLVGLALAPDFGVSKLVYVVVTSTVPGANVEVRAYRENANGTGDYLGVVHTVLEPPADDGTRLGGGVAFGPDGCLFVGVGDGDVPWNAQVLIGADPPPVDSGETDGLCTDVCLGPDLYPTRSVPTDGAPNEAGKVLRLAVQGASAATAPPDPALAAAPLLFGTGLRDPVAIAAHPLTGQLYVSERGDGQEADLDVVDGGSDGGWPCLEGTVTAPGVAGCVDQHTPGDVYAQHPAWRRPIVALPGNGPPLVAGAAAYTGLGYPAEYYGDVFYVLRDNNARIYRVDLAPPCFLPDPAGVAPIAFHDDGNNDDDFTVLYDLDGDHIPDDLTANSLTAVAMAPNPLGQQVLYVAGRQNGGGFDDHSVVFRIEYATEFVPYDGPTTPIADACFTNGTYSGGGGGTVPYQYANPFHRTACQPTSTGVCAGKADGTACDDGNACNGHETCQAGICRADVPPADGTRCVVGSDPCTGSGRCTNGTCVPGGGPEALSGATLLVKGERALALTGTLQPDAGIAPSTRDALGVTLEGTTGPLFTVTLSHPASDPHWRSSHPPHVFHYADGAGRASGVTSVRLRQAGADYRVRVRGRRMSLSAVGAGAVHPQIVVGDQCFTADLTCTAEGRALRCR